MDTKSKVCMIGASSSTDDVWYNTKINGLQCTRDGRLRYTDCRTRVRTAGVFRGTPIYGWSKLRGRFIKAMQVRDPRTNRMRNVGYIVLEAFGYTCPKGYEVDHIDHNPCNNALDNIRFVSHADNLRNRRAYVQTLTQHSLYLLGQKDKYGVTKIKELPPEIQREYHRRAKASKAAA